MASALMSGWLRHRRYAPRAHAFRYGVDLIYLDLDELDRVMRAAPFWSQRWPALLHWRRKDYLAPRDEPLREAVRDRVEAVRGVRPAGRTYLLTQPRYFGFVFNPVSFYYCVSPDGRSLEGLVAEITNTPWGERHAYVLTPEEDEERRVGWYRWRFEKAFYVSPFHSMRQDYDWRFSVPGDGLLVHMENFEDGELCFDATMRLRRRKWSTLNLARSLARNPFMTAKTLVAIYYQALRLQMKRVPRHPHSAKSEGPVG